MKNPIYDNDNKQSKKRRLNQFLDEEYRMLVCGNTNTVTHMLRKPLVYCNKIYLYTPNY